MVHVKYPSMERQDLTQGQLGSFKFIPVDEAPPSSQAQPHPLLLQQYNQSLRNAGFLKPSTYSHEGTNDHSFFNQQIRPSLDASRLRFGPATVRAAVESASTSPQKRFGHRAQGAMRPSAHSFQPNYVGSEHESTHSIYTSDGNSAPLTLSTSDSYPNSSIDFSHAHSSVLRALESEQVAHEATKARLEQEIAARREAEAETARLTECNKGLITSVNLLKSTVRHMVQKESKSTSRPPGVDSAVEDFKRQAMNTNSRDTILYDVLSNYKATQTTMKGGEEKTISFDLDLLSTPDANDKSEKAQLQRTLRKQMGIAPTVDDVKASDLEYHQKIESIVKGNGQLLANVAPRHDESRSEAIGETLHSHELPQKPTDTKAPQISNTSNIMLELPASFLNKYNKKSADAEAETLPPVKTPQKTNLTSTSGTKPQHYDMINSARSKSSAIIWMPDSPLINWKIDNRHRDELRGRGASVQTRSSDSHFLDYPLRYIPDVLNNNLYRTVMIDFIPFGTPYSDVLNQIRGGTLELIQMYGPIGNATDFVTARVIYTDENGATALYSRGQDPGIKINGSPVRIWQVLEATYPKNKDLEKAVYVHGHTRILAIHAPIVDIKDLLKQKLRKQIEAGLVLDIGSSHDGVPIVEFTSIEESTKALEAFLDDKDFAGADFDFDDDYCNSRFPDDASDNA